MSDAKNGNVRFVRIGGRVVPIKSNGAQAGGKAPKKSNRAPSGGKYVTRDVMQIQIRGKSTTAASRFSQGAKGSATFGGIVGAGIGFVEGGARGGVRGAVAGAAVSAVANAALWGVVGGSVNAAFGARKRYQMRVTNGKVKVRK